MGTTTPHRTTRPQTPVTMYWQINDNDKIAPRLTIHSDDLRDDIFDAHDVDSLSELEDTRPATRSMDEVRFGIVAGDSDNATYYTETDLLTRVDGITHELATGLIQECGDIPTLCERQRRLGDVFLGDLLHDADVEGHDWAPELDALCKDLGHGGFERRLKAADVWVEPDTTPGA